MLFFTFFYKMNELRFEPTQRASCWNREAEIVPDPVRSVQTDWPLERSRSPSGGNLQFACGDAKMERLERKQKDGGNGRKW